MRLEARLAGSKAPFMRSGVRMAARAGSAGTRMATAGRTSPGKKRLGPRSKASARKASAKPARGKAGAALDAEKKAQAARVVRRLKADYPAATCALENETPFELLVATILSAQCTDVRVNMVTP